MRPKSQFLIRNISMQALYSIGQREPVVYKCVGARACESVCVYIHKQSWKRPLSLYLCKKYCHYTQRTVMWLQHCSLECHFPWKQSFRNTMLQLELILVIKHEDIQPLHFSDESELQSKNSQSSGGLSVAPPDYLLCLLPTVPFRPQNHPEIDRLHNGPKQSCAT